MLTENGSAVLLYLDKFILYIRNSDIETRYLYECSNGNWHIVENVTITNKMEFVCFLENDIPVPWQLNL